MLTIDGEFERTQAPADINHEISDSDELDLTQFTAILREIREQPPFRTELDREMDFRQGNQLDSQLLSRMKELGIPPATENLIGINIESALGAEIKKRTDWRVIPDGDKEGQDVADAFNYKLNQAERRSRADRACSDAYEQQYSIGIGWIEVTREQNPFKYPYRCNHVHRNEMFWDWQGYLQSPMGEEARYLIRRKWVDKDVAKLQFPDQAELLEHSVSGWGNFDMNLMDGGRSTDLYQARDVERGWTIEEAEWRNVNRRRIQLCEVWYRRWYNTLVLKTPNGRVVELDQDNDMHMMAVAAGMQPEAAIISKVRKAWWAGPHKLTDEPTPYLHNHFGYVPFWGSREDRTGVPFGRIRDMMYTQENINASLSKIRWGLASVRTIRTSGAYVGSNSQLRNEVANVNADIVLDEEHMRQPGARFEISRDFELNEQQYKMQVDARDAMTKLGGVSAEFMGQQNQSNSATQFNATVEQSNQGLANIDDNFKESRSQVGELLLSMIVQDSIGKPEVVNIDGGALREDRAIPLNQPALDEDGMQYLNNDVERILLKVDLSDVPSSSSFRQQQLAAFSEAFKSTTPVFQQVMMPWMINLMDVPDKDEIVKAMKEVSQQPSAEQLDQKNKQKELEIKLMLVEAQIRLITAQGIKTTVDAEFAAMQAAAQVVLQPAITPTADVVMQNAGYQAPVPAGVDPGFSNQPYQPPTVTPEAAQQAQAAQQTVTPNTSPQMPAVPQQENSAQRGIETSRNEDMPV
jgi:hypothetical protein